MIRAKECPVLIKRTPGAAAVLKKDKGERVVRSWGRERRKGWGRGKRRGGDGAGGGRGEEGGGGLRPSNWETIRTV